ncbi:MAG: hypothetical protein JSV50_00855 [Desulfobacteraceae bacterium]|nr:MAG: hypothetical protein JSV50_00855 [Desulfobacteraceae bacterium]
MPMIDLKDKDGNVRWIHVFPFSSLDLARSYVNNSSVPLRIVKSDYPVYWVCNTEDADWAIRCGYKELK